jgi:hypothetical protein
LIEPPSGVPESGVRYVAATGNSFDTERWLQPAILDKSVALTLKIHSPAEASAP